MEEREETETERDKRLGTGATPVCSQPPTRLPMGQSCLPSEAVASLLVWFRLVLDRK